MKVAKRFENLAPYVPIEPFEVLSNRLGKKPEEIIKLDANENLFGPSPRAMHALASLNFPHIYPDPENRALRISLADFTGIAPEYLFPGAGADELIDLLLRVILDSGDSVIVCRPSFPMYDFDTELNNGCIVNVPRKSDFTLDIPGIIAAVRENSPKIILLANPNNPTGNLAPSNEIDELLNLPVLVVIDEAYIEFCTDGGLLGEKVSRVTKVPEHNNLVVLRTFSKWAGLAGLRVGYGAFPSWLMEVLWKAKQPYNVNVAATEAAIASLGDLDYLATNVACLRVERERVFQSITQISFLRPFPSQANFVLCQVVGRDAAKLKMDLMEQGIMVRYYNTAELSGCIRISIGRPEQNNILLKTLKQMDR